MGYRFLLILMVILLAPAGYLVVVPRQKLGAMGGLINLPEIPAPATPKSMAKLELETPLGILVLDQSGSMKTSDPEFIQSLASEVFVFFFAHLIKEDTAPSSRDGIHAATLFYPRIDHKGAIRVAGRDMSLLSWPLSTAPDKRWLRIDPTPSGATQASDAIQQRFEEVMGKIGRDMRNGEDTPHKDVAPAVVALAQDYRQQMGAKAEIFVVYMTDAGTDVQFLSAQQEILRSVPGVHLAAAPLVNRQDADNLIPSFLRALQLDELDVTTEAKGQGFDLTAFGGRPVPFLVSSRTKPEVMTDTGVAVPVFGRNGLYYGICDPKEAKFAKSRLLKVKSDWGLEMVRVFRRPWWELKLEPHYYDMLDGSTVPRVSLSYISGDRPDLSQARTATVTTRSGRTVGGFAMTWDEGLRSFTGPLPGAAEFPVEESEFLLLCKQDKGDELRLPFTVLRTVRLRFVDRTTGKSSRTADYLSFFPMHQKP